MSLPKRGDSSPAAPAEAVRIDTAKAAREPPKVSSGRLYMLTLKAAAAKKLMEMPTAAHPAFGAAGIAAVARPSTEAARQTRKRALTAAMPPCIHCREIQPPAKPPAPANTGGIHAYH